MDTPQPSPGAAAPDVPATGRRRVTTYFLGGTISMTGEGGHGAPPTLGADRLVAGPAAGPLVDVDLDAVDLAQVSSARITFDLLLEVLALARRAVDEGASGVVVVQGTDTLEETAYVLDLLWDRPEPLVLTGAMRRPSAPGADGPANLLAAITVAATPACRDLGVLVVLDDVVHAARRAHKAHPSATDAFRSSAPGPLGELLEGEVALLGTVLRLPALPTPATVDVHVDLLTALLGDDPRRYAGAAATADGLVVAGLGAGHVAPEVADVLAEAAARLPVVLVSRTGTGSVHRRTYGGAGSEVDLLDRGLLHGGRLAPLRARLLLTLLLAAGASRDEVAATVAAHASG
ncbi:asparaginase [Nocardioides sp. HDW12B]|uniref:asparaginase domain-containing protein n=1 Tax=Nocardioides sp. HDW12B TaxID=2714939 RepID=UPI00140D52CF|nr:asparaginase domain-containing protein [Nocardioides sp. HDW12B]QIK67831.1 asparaginase [Nocardioides sp. HDW12B]